MDDNHDAAGLLSRALKRLGHQVEVAHDPAEALSLVEGFWPEIAILDIGLPVMDGYQLARELRVKLGPRTHLLALSGYAQERDMRRSLEAGFARHLVKPADMELLLREIAGLPGSGA
ncbi:MAG: response regulator [Myxococcales bacterium]